MRKSKSLKKNMIIILMVFSLCLTPFFGLTARAAGSLITGSFKETKSVANAGASTFNYYNFVYLNNLKNYFDSNLDPGDFYKVTYDVTADFTFWNAGNLNAFDLNLEFYNSTDTDGSKISRVNLIHQSSSKSFSANVSDQLTSTGYFIIYADDIAHTYYAFDYGFNYFSSTNILTFTSDFKIDIKDVVKLSESEAEIYQKAYQDGYDAGEEQGWSDGVSVGQNVGYELGYEAGFNAAYDDAYNDVYDDAYNQGVQDGQSSVDTDQYYDHGFLDGVNSVDTDSYYQAGYQAGLSSGYDAAYDEGYSSGFNLGYAEAYKDIKNEVIEDLGSSGTSEGEKFTVVQDLDISDSNLNFHKANTTLPSIYDYEFDDEYILESGLNIGEEVFFDTQVEMDDSLDIYSYYYTGAKKLFTADASAYAYKIELQLANTSYEQNNILWARNTIGKWSDIMSGESELGLGFSDGSVGNFTYYIVTDNIPIDVYSAVLFYFRNTASFDLSSKMTFKITPYSRNEYAAMMQNMDQNFDDLEDALSKEFDDLKNGYDSSDGDNSNNDLDDSLDGFSEAEDSLFEDSKSSLSDFEFFDFNSVPSMLTGISFVTASMTSIYNAMGGNSGIGIILSVLFSVMLISICLGIYKRYQSKR